MRQFWRTFVALPLSLIIGVALVAVASTAALAEPDRLTPKRGGSDETTLPAGSSATETAAEYAIPADRGGDLYLAVDGRLSGSGSSSKAYRAKVRVRASGALSLYLVRVIGGRETTLAARDLPQKLASGDRLSIQLSAAGATPVQLQARAWLSGSARPSAQLTASDGSVDRATANGSRRAWAYLSSSSSLSQVSVDVETLEGTATPAPVTPAPTTPAPTTPKPTTPETTTPEPTTPETTTPKPAEGVEIDPASPASPVEPEAEPAAPEAEPAAPATGRAADSAGAQAPTSRTDQIPSGAVYVSRSGASGAAGTRDKPLATIAQGIAKARAGGTVVVRGGSYHEDVVVDKQLTIMGHPGEEVWLDGSSVASGWTKSGSTWAISYSHRFDASPSFTKGAKDGTAEAWRFVNSAHPMAAHPDQVFVNGTALREVQSLSKVTSGTFFVDDGARRLHIGSDPSGRQVRVSDLTKAISVRADNVTLKGIGVRRYATSMWMMGSVTLERTGGVADNLVVEDNASIGIGVYGRNVTLNRITVRRNGLMGINANGAYGLKATKVASTDNNVERFNQSPAAGGFKITRTRGVTVRDSHIAGNAGPGLWFDESVYDAKAIGNNLIDNSGHGLSFEISSTAVLADNLVLRNGGFGFKINNADKLQIWNNTFVSNDRAINLVQDPRRNSQTSTPGHDPQRPNPDPTVPWILRDITVGNNVVAQGTGRPNCLVCVEDYSKQHSAAQMAVKYSGNAYQHGPASTRWFAVWSNGAGDPKVFNDLKSFRSGTGQDAGAAYFANGSSIDAQGRLSEAARKAVTAAALPSAVASATGRTGVTTGVWR